MDVKMKLATILRRMADRLAPAPAGDCQSGANWISYSVNVPAGVSRLSPVFSITAGNSLNSAQVTADQRAEQGEGWSAA